MDNYIIKDIAELGVEDKKLWGTKFWYLSDVLKKGVKVPAGFGIAIRNKKYLQNDEYFSDDVRRYFEALKKKTRTTRFIVRSSMQCEDEKKHVFPGIYNSKKNIKSFEELITAIWLCYDSFYSNLVIQYKKALDMDNVIPQYFGIIIQEQIEPEYSGVLFTKVPIQGYYETNSHWVEIINGHCQNMLLGTQKGNSYLVNRTEDNIVIRQLECFIQMNAEEVEKIIEALELVVNEFAYCYKDYLDIEWGYSNKQITIFQIRPVSFLKNQRENNGVNKPEAGLKAAAMKKFYDLGIFPRRLLIIDNATKAEIDSIEKLIYKKGFSQNPITIRYSYKSELGLPRGFAKNPYEAGKYIRRTYNPGWTIILYESINVVHSYELYLDEHKAILEHLPGMWESDNKEPTDIWFLQNNHINAYSANCIRRAKYENNSTVKYYFVSPYDENKMKMIIEKIKPYISKLRDNWNTRQGINFHFVEDESGTLFFLNQRNIGRVPDFDDKQRKVAIIETKEDIKNWHGEDILLKINLKRGQEILIKEFVPFLKRADVKVYVQFGILSHPAILLREMGIDVRPEYSMHNKFYFSI